MAKGLTGIAADLGEARHHIKHCEETIAHQREVIEKWNEIDKANTAKIEELTLALEAANAGEARAQGIVDDLDKRIDLECRKRGAAEEARRKAEDERNHFAGEMIELKSRLHKAETQLARLHGYVDRVHDLDEIGREPLTTITERTERPGRRDRVDVALTGDGCASNGERRRHWTSYGQ